MKNRLKPGERCPLHHNAFCACHRMNGQPITKASGPVRRVEDPHHPRGYREICSPSELRRRKHRLLAEGRKCWLCKEKFETYGEIDLEHKEPKGMGGARRDDHMDNLDLAHHSCNMEKASKRIG